MELSTSSISNEIDKSIQEEFSVSQAAIDDIKLRKEKGEKPESISNEEIKKEIRSLIPTKCWMMLSMAAWAACGKCTTRAGMSIWP